MPAFLNSAIFTLAILLFSAGSGFAQKLTELNPVAFRVNDTSNFWLDYDQFRGVSFAQAKERLDSSNYRLANKAEVANLLNSIESGDQFFEDVATLGGFPEPPTPGSRFRFLTGVYDDSSTGSDPSKVGAANITVDFKNGTREISFFDDSTPTSEESLGGAWVILKEGATPRTGPKETDFDLDGVNDKVVWRESTGTWFIKLSTVGRALMYQWGLPGDRPIHGDFDGDGLCDLAVWRPSNGVWFVLKSNEDYRPGFSVLQQFGLPGDSPLLQDFDSDGILDFAVWRPSNGNFYTLRSSDQKVFVEQFGLPGDIVPYSAPGGEN